MTMHRITVKNCILILLIIAETFSCFQETAARMNISQSALTNHIHKLEEELENEKFIIHSSSTGIPHDETQKFMNLCAAHKFEPHIVAESNLTSTMIRYVSIGQGIAILNRRHIPWDVDNVKIIDFYPAVQSYIYLLYPRRLTSVGASDFLHYMLDLCSE